MKRIRQYFCLGFALFFVASVNYTKGFADDASGLIEPKPIGIHGDIGCRTKPQKTSRLNITDPGVYENYLIDGQWADGNLVKIRADNVTLRHCEIRHGRHNGIVVYGDNVLIESCRIHHLLKGTFSDQKDAHGITGTPEKLTIRNCDIYYVSGDAVQFDPKRDPWTDVLIDDCNFWSGPLPEDAAGFVRGQCPGENAVDTKQLKIHPRSRMVLRNCYFYGWSDGTISNQAALNLKDHVHVAVLNCAFRDNEICFRLRGGSGSRGGALVKIRRCAVYDSKIAVRMEDNIEDLTIRDLGIGTGIKRKYQIAKGVGPGFENKGEFTPPPLEVVLRNGVNNKVAANATSTDEP